MERFSAGCNPVIVFDCRPTPVRVQTMTLPPPAPPIRPRWPRTPPDVAWTLFLVWTAVGVVVMPLGIGETQVRGWLAGHADAADAAVGFLRAADAVWMLLAAVVVYFHTVTAEGLPTARRWAVIILGGSAFFEWVGARTGFPFGPYAYTDRFGWRIGGVLPLAIPLAWLVILLCGRCLVRRIWPDAARLPLALGVAAVAVLTDLNLEFVAWKVRGYWVWYPGAGASAPGSPPLQNYAAWFALSFALAALLPPNHALRLRRPSPSRPILVLALMNALFLLVRAARLVTLETR